MYKFSEVNFLDIDENSNYIKFIENVIGQAFKVEKIEELNLYINVILTNPENIRKINKEYRDINKETDVLSFPMFEKHEIEEMIRNGNNVQEVLGDIIISVKKVEEQANEYGHSFEREFAYMLIHGFYHLMGYDHIEEEDKNLMREKEENVLKELSISR